MLTPTQIRKLEPLTKHPKFGKLLIEAIKGWKHTTPRKGSFGIELGLKQYRSLERKCCLLGAAVIKKQHNSNYHIFDHITNRFDISENECRSLIYGFDGLETYPSCDKEAYEFANKINKILNPLELKYYE